MIDCILLFIDRFLMWLELSFRTPEENAAIVDEALRRAEEVKDAF